MREAQVYFVTAAVLSYAMIAWIAYRIFWGLGGVTLGDWVLLAVVRCIVHYGRYVLRELGFYR